MLICKTFPTLTAGIQLISSVTNFVNIQLSLCYKPFLTHRTHIRPWLVILWILSDNIIISFSTYFKGSCTCIIYTTWDNGSSRYIKSLQNWWIFTISDATTRDGTCPLTFFTAGWCPPTFFTDGCGRPNKCPKQLQPLMKLVQKYVMMRNVFCFNGFNQKAIVFVILLILNHIKRLKR